MVRTGLVVMTTAVIWSGCVVVENEAPLSAGEACGEHRDCAADLLCLGSVCTADSDGDTGGDGDGDVTGDGDGDGDIGGDGDGDAWSATPVEFEIADCAALQAHYAEETVCDRSFLIGEYYLDSDQGVQPGTTSALSGCEVVTGDVVVGHSEHTDLSFLSGLRGLCGNLHIDNNDALLSVSGTDNVTHILGDVRMLNNPTLTSIDALSNVREVGAIWLGNNNLADLDGLSSLERTQRVMIGDSALQNIDGLSALRVVREFWLTFSPGVTDLNAIQNLETVTQTFVLQGMSGLTELPSFANTRFEFILWVLDTPLTSLAGLASADLSATASLQLDGTDVTSLEGFEGLGPELYEMRLLDNPHLSSVAALSGMQTLEAELRILGNPSLEGLDGLEGLESALSIVVADNDVLNTCSAKQLLSSVSVEQEFAVHSNAGPDNCD